MYHQLCDVLRKKFKRDNTNMWREVYLMNLHKHRDDETADEFITAIVAMGIQAGADQETIRHAVLNNIKPQILKNLIHHDINDIESIRKWAQIFEQHEVAQTDPGITTAVKRIEAAVEKLQVREVLDEGLEQWKKPSARMRGKKSKKTSDSSSDDEEDHNRPPPRSRSQNRDQRVYHSSRNQSTGGRLHQQNQLRFQLTPNTWSPTPNYQYQQNKPFQNSQFQQSFQNRLFRIANSSRCVHSNSRCNSHQGNSSSFNHCLSTTTQYVNSHQREDGDRRMVAGAQETLVNKVMTAIICFKTLLY